MRSKTLLAGVGVVLGVLLSTAVVLAGSLNPTVGPTGAASQMYTLEQIYQRLTSGGNAVKMTAFSEPSRAPGTGTMHTLDEIMAAAPVADNTNGATTAQVLTTKTFWGLRTDGTWGMQTGAMPNNGAVAMAPKTTVQSIAAGYHNGSGTVLGDPDLAAGNIKRGVNLFGVAGTLYNAGVPKTGQTTLFAAGDDGDLEKGVAWPNPRFITGTTGVVTDTLTGLIWLKNANCANADRNWATALTDVAQLNTNGTMNGNNCGDTSNGGNHQTDWRLPNVHELQSIVHYGFFSPAVPNTAGTGQWTAGDPFTAVQSSFYWTSNTDPVFAKAWVVSLYIGVTDTGGKVSAYYVWPVRGGQ